MLQVARWCDAHPDRFSGLAGSIRRAASPNLKDLDHAINDLGFVGAHSYPHWFSRADAARRYPIYARCAELGVPIMMQVGQNSIYQKDVRLPSVARTDPARSHRH